MASFSVWHYVSEKGRPCLCNLQILRQRESIRHTQEVGGCYKKYIKLWIDL